MEKKKKAREDTKMTDAEKLYEWWNAQELHWDEDDEFKIRNNLDDEDGYLEVGLKGESNYQNNIADCAEEDVVFCVAEPTNPYDKNAVKVCMDESGERIIGYFPRDVAKLLSPLLKGNVLKAPIQSIAGGYEDKKYKGVWIRLYIKFNRK